MGLLDDLGAWLDQKKRNVAVNAQNLPGLLASFAQDVQQGAAADKSAWDASRSVMPGVREAGIREMNARGQELGGLLGAIKAFHGSPHKFDKFDLSKIGTGEGAQAYGHGIYLADNPAVAEEYATKLDPSRWETAYTVGGKPVTPRDPEWTMAQEIAAIGKDGAIQKQRQSIESAIAKVGADNPVVKAKERVLQKLIDFPEVKDVGRLVGSKQFYEASIRWPDAAREAADPLGPQHFLDWDKPLSEQSEKVREIAAKRLEELRVMGGGSYIPNDPTGEWLHKAFGPQGAEAAASGYGQTGASARLRDAGIPGIRYLDGGSRGAGQGTHNYVVFDDNLLEILKRNGEPVQKQGLLSREPTKFELAHAEAQRNAALPIEQGGLGLGPNNTAMERAKAMGFTRDVYHATPNDFSEFQYNNWRGGSFVGEDPAKTLVGSRAGSGEMQFAKADPTHILPLKMSGKVFGIDEFPEWFLPREVTYGQFRNELVKGKHGPHPLKGLTPDQEEALNSMRTAEAKQRYVEGVPESEWGKYAEDALPLRLGPKQEKRIGYGDFEGVGTNSWIPGSTLKRENFRDLLRRLGFDSAAIADEAGKSYAVMDTSKLRSRFAAFDPKKKDSRDLLASMGLLGLLGAGAYGSDYQ